MAEGRESLRMVKQKKQMKTPYHVILASNSPRRKELLAGLDLPFQVRVLQNIDESYPADLPTEQIAEFISKKKAQAYAKTMADDELVITADTVVILGNEVTRQMPGGC